MMWKKVTQHFEVVILVAVLMGFLWPSPGIYARPVLAYLLMVLMFMSCLTIRPSDIVRAFQNIRELLLLLGIIHLVPLAIVLLCSGLFQSEIVLGLVLIAISPAAFSSVFLCKLCKGDTAGSLAVVTVSNMLAPVLILFSLGMVASGPVAFSMADTVWSLLQLVVFPAGLALVVGRFRVRESILKVGNVISLPILVVIVWAAIAPAAPLIGADLLRAALLFVISSVIILVNFGLSWLVGRSYKDKVMCAIVGTYKNFTLPVVLALSVFGVTEALPAIIFAVSNNLWIAPMHWWFGRGKK